MLNKKSIDLINGRSDDFKNDGYQKVLKWFYLCYNECVKHYGGIYERKEKSYCFIRSYCCCYIINSCL
jgi:hypothetical protein